MNVAVILAGGTGSRLGGDLPKQFLTVGGRMVIEYSVDAFEQHSGIDEICIVCHADYLNRMQCIVQANAWAKVRKVLTGGKERYQSCMAAIQAYDADDNLLLHDAARPLVSQRIITDCLEALRTCSAVGVAVPATDTVVEVDEHNRLKCVLRRATLRNMQTPQCFRQSTILQAYALALQDPAFCATDDCSVVRQYLPEVPVCLVEGEHANIKITYPEDLRRIFPPIII
ncbi:MAG: 2-C-methyl-D-erythritol 4-phosphate cytidylyltransferase [Mediterranea sp.]|jgi:2-C-methyl-D-erythritol 4-phosphate cytidylyltransferase|nr:2-C-methyl-D-erythritol 4-phosphate cytidylyltransferase [Mediterranea sp.]